MAPVVVQQRYLSADHASITRLNLAKADIDDVECASFMTAIEKNRKLTALDLSHNLIG